jgi:hypothetical protein
MIYSEVPKFQNLEETKTSIMLVKTVAYFMSQNPRRMDAKAIRRGLNAYMLSCSGEPNA